MRSKSKEAENRFALVSTVHTSIPSLLGLLMIQPHMPTTSLLHCKPDRARNFHRVMRVKNVCLKVFQVITYKPFVLSSADQNICCSEWTQEAVRHITMTEMSLYSPPVTPAHSRFHSNCYSLTSKILVFYKRFQFFSTKDS